ncbi:MAG TPA: S9 family peptidase [Acidobacteriota bacterium]|nr:S9 family peptidase [Acidobacteriota bacterium]
MKRPLIRFFVATCLLSAFSFVAAAQEMGAQDQEIQRLKLETYLDFERVSNPRISPDGKQVLYTRRWVNKMEDKWESEVWIMKTDGSYNRFLVKGSDAQWSPSGDRILFTAPGEPKGNQIFVRWMDAEGAVSQVTRLTQSPSDPTWAPDGKSIAFTMFVDAPNKDWNIDLPRPPKGADWTPSPKIVERLRWRRDRVGDLPDGHRHIFTVPAEGGTPRQITSGDWDHDGIEFTPDGNFILFDGLRVENAELAYRESEIYKVEVASGEITQLTTRKGPDGNPLVSPDGRKVAYLGRDWTDDPYLVPQIYVMGIDGSHPRLISGGFDRRPGDLTWAADGSGLYFTSRSEGRANVRFLSAEGGSSKVVTQGEHLISLDAVAPGGLAVGTRSAPHDPADIVAFNLKDASQIRRLTRVNDDILNGITLGQVNEIVYESSDGLEIQGWYITPPGFDPSRRYKMILQIHGGPHGMYGVGFNFGWQEHAANDYVVLYTNPRGSSGYGTEFANKIKYAYPSKDYDDLMAGVDALIAKGFIDEQNMYVTGCSGGGVLTAWVVGHTDRFAAASSNCPVIDWVSFVGTTDGNLYWYKNFAKFPWEDASEHLRRSPLTYVGNVKTPTMLMTGVKDLRTPIAQTEEFYHALKMLGVPTAMIRFNDEWHGTGRNPSNFMRTQLYLRHWFERHSRSPSPEPADTTGGGD